MSCHTADSKPYKQEVNGTMILPPLVFPALSNILFLDIYESTACSYFLTVSYLSNDAISSITTKELPCYVVKNPFPDLIICILLICVIVTFMVAESHKFVQLKLATQFCIFISNSPTWKKTFHIMFSNLANLWIFTEF